MSNFNEQAILEQANQLVYARVGSFDLSPEETEGYGQFVTSFNEIAVAELSKEPGIQLQEGSEPIPLDEEKALQAVTLFGEGVLYCILRCREYNVPSELAHQLTQQVAMHIYEQAKQVVAATHGQEHTPDFQFNLEQQVEFITQGAESALIHYINEYEQAYGPINPEPESELPTPEALPQSESESIWDEPDEEIGSEPEVITAPAKALPAKTPAPAPSKGEGNHEKYAAVALMLSTLPASQRAKLLKNFSPEEKELIAFYSYPQHVDQNLDIRKVEGHLKKLKTMFGKRDKKAATGSSKRIASLAGLISPQKLLSCVKDERPVVKRYLMAHYPETSGQPEHDPSSEQAVPPLSPRLEEILYNYLAKRLGPELQQSLPNEGSHYR